jgi:Domain of unknown function (DUF4262)
MTDDDDNGFARIARKIVSDIDRYGRSVIGVGSDDAPPFAYTIGNCLVGLPELLVLGMADNDLLNRLSEMMIDRGHGFDDGELVSLGGLHPVKVINATSEAVKDEYTFQVANFTERDDYDVLQIVIPDRNGRFPGDPKCEQPFASIPQLRRFLQ